MKQAGHLTCPACRSDPQPEGPEPTHAERRRGANPAIQALPRIVSSPGGLREPLQVERTTTLHAYYLLRTCAGRPRGVRHPWPLLRALRFRGPGRGRDHSRARRCSSAGPFLDHSDLRGINLPFDSRERHPRTAVGRWRGAELTAWPASLTSRRSAGVLLRGFLGMRERTHRRTPDAASANLQRACAGRLRRSGGGAGRVSDSRWPSSCDR
jgi:hypothetical protein